jgi:hypothetical protein
MFHINRSPIEGTIKRVNYVEAKNASDKRRASFKKGEIR